MRKFPEGPAILVEAGLDQTQYRIPLEFNELGKNGMNEPQSWSFVHKGVTPVAPIAASRQ